MIRLSDSALWKHDCAAAQSGLELGFALRPERTRSQSGILTLIDEYTKECLAIHAGYSIRAVDAITVLEAAIERYGTVCEPILETTGGASDSWI
jgi:hypothetical protein